MLWANENALKLRCRGETGSNRSLLGQISMRKWTSNLTFLIDYDRLATSDHKKNIFIHFQTELNSKIPLEIWPFSTVMNFDFLKSFAQIDFVELWFDPDDWVWYFKL